MSHFKIIVDKKLLYAPLNKCVGVPLSDLTRYKVVQADLEDYLFIPWNIQNVQILAKAGYVVSSPILHEYKWAGKYDPFSHQYQTADFLVKYKRGFVLNDIGTGKSMSALWASDYLMNSGQVRRVLVASTTSTLHRVWEREINTHLLHRTCAVLTGSKQARVKKLNSDADFLIINHEGLKVIQKELMERTDIDLIIVDEGARFRNKKTGLWQTMYNLSHVDAGKNRSIWWMTGSPTPREPTDAWAQAQIISPTAVPRSFARFRDQVMIKLNMFKYVPRRGWETSVMAALQPSIRFKREECIDLPPCTYVDHTVEMSKPQLEAYESMKKDLVVQAGEGLVTAFNEAVKIGKLLQIACGMVYYEDDSKTKNVIDLDPAPKKAELKEIIEEVGSKLIIYVPYKAAIKIVTDAIQSISKDLTFGVVHGDVSKTARNEIFTNFQDKDLDILVAHPKTMAHGLTLTASNTIVWWAPVDDFEIYEQANGRVTRPGQARHQYIKHLQCSEIEKSIFKRLKNKESMQGILLDLIKKSA